jgi:SSS family solute:Na+ symporter
MSLLDYAIIIIYFAAVIGIGFWYQRRASKSLQSYFLAGKSMHWLALAMSGSVSNFDITGTMWIVTLIYLFGMKSMWNHWMWGFLMGAFFMSFMGKWVRRSRVMTGAEWMVTRFGAGPDGKTARLAYTLMAVVTLTAFVGYAFQGIGKFASEYVHFGLPPEQAARVCAVGVFAITTLYVLLGGLYSVVITNVIQTIILTASAILLAGVAYFTISPTLLSETLPEQWTSLVPAWRVERTAEMVQAGYAGYYLFGALAIVWVIKGLLLNLGGPGQMYDFQIFLAAASPRDAAKLGAAWSGFLIVRWAMAMGIALLAVTGLLTSADQPGNTELAVDAAVATDPGGEAAPDAAKSASFDAERVMPAVLKKYLWPGVRGLVIAGLLAAFMSTFSATVNSAASYIVRDLWQPLVGSRAGPKQLVWASYAATIGVVAVGTLIGLTVPSIGRIFSWIMMELGAAFAIPNVLRWYWWRLNGWGYAAGTLIGLAAAVAVPFVPNELPLYVTFPAICALSLVGCLAGTWLTRPTDQGVLASFYRHVRPFGLWGPIRSASGLRREELATPSEGMSLALVNVALGSVVILGVYLAPMYLVGHWHLSAAACLGAAIAAAVPLYFTWYRNLPPPETPEQPVS